MPSTSTSQPPMNAEWRTLLTGMGAAFEGDHVLNFGNPDAERRTAANGDILADLSHLAVLRAEGAEAQSFLQSQLSNDVKSVSETRAQLSAYCNAKGRMFAVFLIFRSPGDVYYLQLPADIAEPTLKRLRMFILRAKVKLEFADSSFGQIGLSGPNAEATLKATLGKVPRTDYDCISIDEITAIRIPGPYARFVLYGPLQRLQPLWSSLSLKAMPVGAGPWSWLDILAGIPMILPGTVEEFVPQMTNVDLVGGVSFSKGCYPGQEIVARMHYLGRLKQRMFRAHVECGDSPRPGTPLYAPNLPGQSVGHVLTAQPGPDGGHDLLVVAQLSSHKEGELHLHAFDGPQLILRSLPYPLPSAETTQ